MLNEKQLADDLYASWNNTVNGLDNHLQDAIYEMFPNQDEDELAKVKAFIESLNGLMKSFCESVAGNIDTFVKSAQIGEAFPLI